MKFDIYQVDAFTDQLFSGNPAAVVPLDHWLAGPLLQQIAAENNLSETAFYIPAETGYSIRWFTPASEVDLCGHATLATAHVLWQEKGVTGDILTFESRSGSLVVKRTGQEYVMDFPTDRIVKTDLHPVISSAFNLPPVEVWKGREDYLILYPGQEEILQLQPDFRLLKTLQMRGVIATAPGHQTDFVSRCFFPLFGVDEDPVTGSAHTTLAPFWSARLGKTELTARQLSQRGGSLGVRLAGDRTLLTGKAVTYLSGTIYL